MIQCSACGARNAEVATFCVRCGADLRASEAPGESTDALSPVSDVTMVLPTVEQPTEVSAAERLLEDAAKLLDQNDAHAAAAKCREAIALAPDLVAAYSLLGMAEELRGNTVAAAGAYRRVLQLDPSRTVEREKLELLYATGAAIRPEDEVAEEEAEIKVLRYAPWVAAVGAAFLVLIILTTVGLRVHAARQAERTYQEQMAIAQKALDAGDYEAAVAAFRVALRVRPGDKDADSGLRYAQRKLAGTTSAQLAQPMPQGATILPSSGPNPFPPRIIGPTAGQQPPEQPQSTAGRSTGSAPRPPVVDTSPVIGGGNTGSTTGGSASVPFGPLETAAPAPPERTTTPTTPPAAEPPEEVSTAPERRGEITIWTSEGPARPSNGAASSGGGSSQSSPSPPPTSLRQQADQARAAGDHGRASELYSAAIEAYRADSQAHPAKRQANEAAIEACERARRLCAAEGQ